ncbi:resolvase [Burkholderia phage BcepSauron]|uniref:Resolvase n=2 Tax=Sarumanvirus TaxID=2843450 RepID=A0A482MM79_9CAUD|nr:Holliday junction resolvase [Burkholderia phage BcepSaruman]YP_009904624.1 Holliday junction resolvase [Burkholderia phage BcepSauron]QBQ74626.1 resolvase [Burkholderia phage BcepSauron]QBX06658.1 resolvase-like protein [Burkholderia phage BcepSaruman]
MAKKKVKKPREAYVLPETSGLAPDTKRVLALDPGSSNTGIALVAVNSAGRVKVMANAVLEKPVADLTKFGESRTAFLAEIKRWVDLYQPQGFIAERFMTRGQQSMGTTIECVSVMIGLMAGTYPEIPMLTIPAAQWKNAWHHRHKGATLEETYKISRTTPHQVDAAFIGIYALERGLGKTFEYDPMRIVHQAEITSCTRLVNRRPKKR